MCGISGILSARSFAKPEDVQTMMSAMRHRGPDDHGMYVDGSVGLGHNRLSIIDLSANGHQPMFDEAHASCIVFNGEVYNFQLLRDELRARGYSFRSKTDTEVILAAYNEFGFECVKKFRGMFAFAIWDPKKRILFMARDRLGKKPLYFFSSDSQFAFASELKALFRLDWVPKTLDPVALHEFLTLQYVPGPRTMYQGISKLLPGHYLVVQISDDGLAYEEKQYWEPSNAHNGENPDDSEASARVIHLLEESIKLRLLSDVEVGVLLSGGLDSSLIVAIASQLNSKPMKTFSVRFKDESLNENEFATDVANMFGTDHYSLIADEVSPDLFLKVIEHLDEPLADPACVPLYMIASLASQHVKVVLSGEGADELFGGYPYYVHEKMFAPVLEVPLKIRMALASFTGTFSGPLVGAQRAARLEKVLSSDKQLGSVRWSSVFTGEDIGAILSSDFLKQANGALSMKRIMDLFEGSKKRSLIEKTMEVDLKVWLPDDLLMKVDKMTMAHSVEARTPYLDHFLVEYVLGLNVSKKIRGLQTKVILKQVAKRYLPDSIIKRKKHGFEVPIASWMLNNFRELCEQTFDRQQLKRFGVFNAEVVEQEWSSLKRNGVTTNPRRLWLLFCFSQWMEQYRMERAF